jgi:hypothetical protein
MQVMNKQKNSRGKKEKNMVTRSLFFGRFEKLIGRIKNPCNVGILEELKFESVNLQKANLPHVRVLQTNTSEVQGNLQNLGLEANEMTLQKQVSMGLDSMLSII